MTTVAKPTPTNGAHFYDKLGVPCHFVPKKDGTGDRPSTIVDARKNNWFPGVTNVLKILDKPALTSWLVEQGVLAVLTTPRLPGEADDAFVFRVLHTEKQQEQEAGKARDLGTEIHAAIEAALNGQPIPSEIMPYVAPVLIECKKFGSIVHTEKILVGQGYAGKVDLITQDQSCYLITDFKTTGTIPKKEAWPEAKLQLAAYAQMWQDLGHKPIRVQNIYISTKEIGTFKVLETLNWEEEYKCGFRPVFEVWQHLNKYRIGQNPTEEISNTE